MRWLQSGDGTHQIGDIDDPFNGMSLQEIESDARRFHGEAPGLKSLLDVEVLIKGAKLAKDSNAINTFSISDVERRVLAEEERSNLRGLREVIQQFGEGMRVTIMVTACAAAAFGTWVSDPLQGFSLSRNHSEPDNARCEANGIEHREFGTKASVAPIFAAEAAMEKSRGRILMLWQMFDAFGIMLGFVVALIAPVSWEVQLGLALIPSLAQILVVMLCPESPRLLIRNKRYGEAYKSLRRLRRLELQAARDLYFIHFQLRQEVKLYVAEQEIGNSSFPYQDYVEKIDSFKRMRYLFTLPRNRRACLVAFLVMTSQQLCGVRFGASNFVFTLAAFVLIDSKGRRFTLLTSFFFMTITLLGASFCFNIDPEGGRVAAVVVTVILLYTASYSIGAGPVPFMLSAEIFPLAFREVGMSFSVMANFLGLGLLVLFVPRITRSWSPIENERVGQRNVLLLFTGLNATMLFLLFLMGRVATNIRSIADILKLNKNETPASDVALPQFQT
ncbi:major facilitator superfamily domain-containing protein [Aspergillus foveolatus]|uniref:major facilitator superfamily domain-containing protein n=1 Tax=Aspergillus foveolatus TaxID=210207 RepID=UPI003CCD3F70